MWKVIKRSCYLAGLALMSVVLYTHTMLGVSPEWLWRGKFTAELRPVSHVITVDGRQFHYVDTGESDKPVLLLIHGSPGSWLGYENYFNDTTLRDRFRIIAVDRLGFGYSGIGKPERSVQKQAAAVAAIFEKLPPGTAIFVAGHSYGGPVATRLAMDYPERIEALFILAGSNDPELETVHWAQRVAKWPIINLLVPPIAYSTNEEILALQAELTGMMPLWKQIVTPTYIIHGEEDGLVPIGNVDFMEEMLVNAALVDVTRIPNMDHFIIWNQYDVVVAKLYKALARLDE